MNVKTIMAFSLLSLFTLSSCTVRDKRCKKNEKRIKHFKKEHKGNFTN